MIRTYDYHSSRILCYLRSDNPSICIVLYLVSRAGLWRAGIGVKTSACGRARDRAAIVHGDEGPQAHDLGCQFAGHITWPSTACSYAIKNRTSICVHLYGNGCGNAGM